MMQHTTNYNLNQWEADDRVTRADFNADNAKLDAALAGTLRLETGTYTGDGTYGVDNPVTMTFRHRPKLLYVRHGDIATRFFWAAYGTNSTICSLTGSDTLTLTWSGNTLSWYKNGATTPNQQMNEDGVTYYYFAFY